MLPGQGYGKRRSNSRVQKSGRCPTRLSSGAAPCWPSSEAVEALDATPRKSSVVSERLLAVITSVGPEAALSTVAQGAPKLCSGLAMASAGGYTSASPQGDGRCAAPVLPDSRRVAAPLCGFFSRRSEWTLGAASRSKPQARAVPRGLPFRRAARRASAPSRFAIAFGPGSVDCAPCQSRPRES